MVSPLLSLSSQFDNIPDSSCSITLKRFAMRTEVQALWDVFRIDYHHVLPFSSWVVLAKATVTITVSYTNCKYLCVSTSLLGIAFTFHHALGFVLLLSGSACRIWLQYVLMHNPSHSVACFWCHPLDLTVSAACDWETECAVMCVFVLYLDVMCVVIRVWLTLRSEAPATSAIRPACLCCVFPARASSAVPIPRIPCTGVLVSWSTHRIRNLWVAEHGTLTCTVLTAAW